MQRVGGGSEEHHHDKWPRSGEVTAAEMLTTMTETVVVVIVCTVYTQCTDSHSHYKQSCNLGKTFRRAIYILYKRERVCVQGREGCRLCDEVRLKRNYLFYTRVPRVTVYEMMKEKLFPVSLYYNRGRKTSRVTLIRGGTCC